MILIFSIFFSYLGLFCLNITLLKVKRQDIVGAVDKLLLSLGSAVCCYPKLRNLLKFIFQTRSAINGAAGPATRAINWQSPCV